MSQFKALIFDLDGTAIPTEIDAVPSEVLIENVKKAQGLVKVSFATGRSLPHAKNIVKAFSLTDPCVVSGGTRIIDPQTEKTLWEKGLSEGQVKEVMEVLLPYQYPVGFSDEVEGVPAREKTVNGPERVIYVWAVEKEVAEQLKIQLNQIADIAAHIGGSWTEGRVDIHITHKFATKQYALEELIKMLGVKKEEIIGVGDSDNDLPLFASVGFKVAMGNATESLKKAADYIAPSVIDDGLAQVIERFIFNS